MPLAKVKQKGQVTIPAKLRRELGLAEGDYVDISRNGSRIVLTPKETVDRHPMIDAAHLLMHSPTSTPAVGTLLRGLKRVSAHSSRVTSSVRRS